MSIEAIRVTLPGPRQGTYANIIGEFDPDGPVNCKSYHTGWKDFILQPGEYEIVQKPDLFFVGDIVAYWNGEEMVTAEVCDVLQWAPHMDPTYQLFGVEEDMEYLRLELIESAPEKN